MNDLWYLDPTAFGSDYEEELNMSKNARDNDSLAFPSENDLRTFVGNHVFDVLKEWPEDYWIAYSDHWDINIWVDEGCERATVYPINNGQTDTSRGIALYFT